VTAYQPSAWHDLFAATAVALLVPRLRLPRARDEPLAWTVVPALVVGRPR
jgi:hypothetical protein